MPKLKEATDKTGKYESERCKSQFWTNWENSPKRLDPFSLALTSVHCYRIGQI